MQSEEQIRREAEETAQIQQRLETVSELNLEYAYLHNKAPKDLLAVIEEFVQMAGTDAATLDAFEKIFPMGTTCGSTA